MMIRSKNGDMTLNSRQIAILLISAVGIAGVTFAVGYLSKSKDVAEKPPIAATPDVDTPAAPGAITQKLDTDAILKEREVGKSAGSAGNFTFQKTLMEDPSSAKEPAPAVQAPQAVPPAPVEHAKTEKKETRIAAVEKPSAEQKSAGKKQTQEKKTADPAPKDKPKHEAPPASAKPGKMFSIQVASFTSKSDAQKLVARLEAKRFMANIVEFKDNGTAWYRVKVGPYKTEQAAVRDLGRVKTEGSAKAFVTGY
ncbi:MAG: SPOR domain-containing protein [Nitrospinae bacterium]|nr:SPOR domain-containing protein [Nitrospinota bacterium]MBF0634164.1 SPOR domain-containing protein [Nitrospinota bacterium]